MFSSHSRPVRDSKWSTRLTEPVGGDGRILCGYNSCRVTFIRSQAGRFVRLRHHVEVHGDVWLYADINSKEPVRPLDTGTSTFLSPDGQREKAISSPTPP